MIDKGHVIITRLIVIIYKMEIIMSLCKPFTTG